MQTNRCSLASTSRGERDPYRKAGGRVDLHFFKGVGAAFITTDPRAPASIAAIGKIIEFVHREIAA